MKTNRILIGLNVLAFIFVTTSPFIARSLAQNKTVTLTGTTSSPTNTVRVADPDEKVAIGGKIYTVREVTQLHQAITKFIQDLQATPTCEGTRHLYFVSYPYGITMQVCAADRLEAAVNSGITVWTEKEWKERKSYAAPERGDSK